MSVPPPGPLAYEGQVVVPFIVRDFPPTTAFNQFSVPTIWIEPSSENAYILTGKPHGVANWLLFVNGGGNVGTLKGNTGGAVGPTVGGLINVVGDGTTITIAGNPGTNTLTASLIGGLAAVEEFLPDSGTTPVVPNGSGAVTMAGSGSITTVGGLNSLTTQLTGLTNHAVLVGAGTTTITKVGPTATSGQVLQSAGAAADPAFSTATYPSTTTINQILYSSSNNVVGGLATANQAVLTTGATGVPVLTALATNGQLIIGSTAGVPAAATLTAGAGISITNGSNSITIATTGSGATWNDASGVFTAVVDNGYFLTAASTATLPAAPVQGDVVDFICDTTGSCVITANTGQLIRIANQISSSAGTATNSARGDSLSLVYRAATTTWFAYSGSNGGWTTA